MPGEANVSFIVPAYNCARFLPDAVASVFNGNLQPDDEVVLVNDGSTDETQAVIDGLRERHPEVRAFRHNYNKGSAAAARNTGIDNARHDLLFCLDADNLLAPHSVPRLARDLLARGADAATFQEHRFFVADTNDVTHTWTWPAPDITLADALCTHRWAGPTGNYLFTRASWLKAGRYRESVGGGIDSWAFAVAQLATGCRFVVLPDSFYWHRWGHGSAWTREMEEGGTNLKALQVLLPYLHLLEEEEVEYLFGKDGRHVWYSDLEKRPLCVKDQTPGRHGVNRPCRRRAGLVSRFRRRLARLIAPGRV